MYADANYCWIHNEKQVKQNCKYEIYDIRF